MPSPLPTRVPTFKQRVAAHFAKRPDLRAVLAKAAFDVLTMRYPMISLHYPHLNSIEAFSLIPSAKDHRETSSLLDVLLAHFLSGQRLALTTSDQISLAPPVPFRAQERGDDEQLQPEINLRLDLLSTDFDNLLDALADIFHQAQVDFWNAPQACADISRLHWMALTLKAALLSNIQRQTLDDDERTALYALVNGTADWLAVYRIHVTLTNKDSTHQWPLPGMLVTAERDERRLLLWCEPSGCVRSFDSDLAFATALRDELAASYRFDTLSWSRTLLEGDVFELQAVQLLNCILDALERLPLAQLLTVDDLLAQFSHVSDPSIHFVDQACLEDQSPLIAMPDWLSQANANDRFDVHKALLDMSASQALSRGMSALDGVEDLQRYAKRRLLEQMHIDHPDQLPYDPDQLNIWISVPDLRVDPSLPVELTPSRTLSLTQLAISRLRLDELEVATHITDNNGVTVNDWMNLVYINSLVDSVDIGGQYPAYVNALLTDSPQLATRVKRFATEWRSSLLFDALKAKILGQLQEHTWHVLANFCRNGSDESEHLRIAPLAFVCAPGASAHDQVHGMFLIRIEKPSTWILYRPLINDAPLIEFASLDAMMTRIRTGGELLQSVLDWLEDDARLIYVNDGFTRPHLHAGLSSLAHLLGGSPELEDAILRTLIGPVHVAYEAWPDDLDNRMFQAKIKAMLLLASRRSFSHAQQRWASLKQFAWLMFNFVTPLLPGPVATLAWLTAAVAELKDDIPALLYGDEAEKSLAVADILSNLAMVLIHAVDQPSANETNPVQRSTIRLAGPKSQSVPTPAVIEKPEEISWTPPTDSQRNGALTVHRWHNNQRLGNLPAEARKALGGLQAQVSLEGISAQTQGRLRGLFKVGEGHYMLLQGIAYEVREEWGGFRIVGPDQSKGPWTAEWGGEWDGYFIVGRERSKGPWVTRWGGEWVIDLFMAGGMPNRKALAEQNRNEFDAALKSIMASNAQYQKTQKLLESREVLLKPYNEREAAFKKALKDLKAHTGQSDPTLPDEMQAQGLNLRAERTTLHNTLYVLSLAYERQSQTMKSLVEQCTKLLDPRYAKFDQDKIATTGRTQGLELLIENDIQLFNRLLLLADHDATKAQSNLVRDSHTWQELFERQVPYKDHLERTLKADRHLMAVSERLEDNILLVLNDPRIKLEDKEGRVHTVIQSLPFSTMTLRGKVICGLAELSLDLGQLDRKNAEHLLSSQNQLWSSTFKEALVSHDELATANRSLDEQVEILNNALREYETALSKADYLHSLDNSALDKDKLGEYIQELSALKQIAENHLSAALNARDLGIPAPVRPVTNSRTTGNRKLIRTSRGRAILVEQANDDSPAVQHDPIDDKPISTYERRGEQWFAVPSAEHRPLPSNASLRRRGTTLIAQVDGLIAKASQYTNEPNSLSDLMDWHIQDMSEVASQLERGADEDAALASRLSSAIEDMQEQKRQLLTTAYLNTRNPDSTALHYLFQQGEVKIERTVVRKQLGDRDFLDVYAVRPAQSPGKTLWEAHFHYPSTQSPARVYSKGHLKFWEPREKTRKVRLEEAHTSAERISIYRGDLPRGQVDDVIPFPAT